MLLTPSVITTFDVSNCFVFFQLLLSPDSLHRVFNSIPHDKSYWSLPQAYGNWIYMDTLTKEAQLYLRTKPTFEAFLKKYPFAKSEKKVLVMRHLSESWGKGKVIQFESYPHNYPYEFTVTFDSMLCYSSLQKRWLDTILPAHEFRKHDELVACFFEKGFEKHSIPSKYSPKIEYVDFLADTNTIIFPLRGKFSYEIMNSMKLPCRTAFYKLVLPNRNDYRDGDFDYEVDYLGSVVVNDTFVDKLSNLKLFREQLIAASDEALIKKVPSAALENLVLKYLSPAKALQLMRLRFVWSGCANDDRPRIHLYNIAKLAANIANWDIFMNSYLLLLSDPFDFTQTKQELQYYTQQLDTLKINVNDLYLGAFFDFDNATKNHFNISYLGYRVGAVIKEYKYYNQLEKNILDVIADNSLDDYNRFHFWELYKDILDSTFYQESKESNKTALESVLNQKKNNAKAALPLHISSRIKETD